MASFVLFVHFASTFLIIKTMFKKACFHGFFTFLSLLMMMKMASLNNSNDFPFLSAIGCSRHEPEL